MDDSLTPLAEAAVTDVLLVGGPTATGKSALATDLAEALDGVVINADSMQVYADLRILTARPEPQALSRAPHRLFGFLAARERCSAGRWRELALAEIEAAGMEGQLPIVVGGTGLYLEALSVGIAEIPAVPDTIHAEALARHREGGAAGLHAALAVRDPAMAARLHPADTQRLIRAWEVLQATGRSLAEWQAQMVKPPPHLRFHPLLLLPPRQTVYAACDGRFRGMVDTGALDEVKRLLGLRLDPSLPVMKAIGVPELSAFIDGQTTLEAATGRAQTATRRYAKRQLTWFRNRPFPADPPFSDPVVANTQYSETFLSNILRKFRLQR